jgi:pimeloyl-ACP methyl ester carboxylesterase
MSEKTLTTPGYKCRVIVNHASGVPLVFLHGLSYTSEVWQSIGVTQLLVDKQIPFLALDMPYGLKSDCQPKTHNAEKNVAAAKEAIEHTFNKEDPVVVGASMGGHIALQYAARFPVKGLLLIAPARALEESLAESVSKFRFPVRIIWGTDDNIISGEDMRILADKLPNGKLVTYEGAGHSAYRNQPDRFRRDLLELYAAAEQG